MRELPDITGQSIVLSAFRPWMAESYARWLADPYIQRMAGEQPASVAEVLERHRIWTEADDFMEYMVLDRSTGVPIGDVSLNFASGDPHLGVMIAEPSFRGGGRAAEAVELVAMVAQQRGAHRVVAEIYDFNQRSLDFHERMGFTRLRHDEAHGQWIYAKTLRASELDECP